MRVFLDSSALAKRYIQESGSDELGGLCAEADEVAVSALCIPEIISGFNRLKREGRLSPARYASLKKALATDIEEAMIVDLTPEVINRTIDALERTALRSLDAIHVGSAAEALCDLFVTADRQQEAAARRFGLKSMLVGASI